MGYNVFSAFNGIGCGFVALERAGIKVDKYYSSEIDVRANKVNDFNWPKTIQFGDITKIKAEHFLSKIDILCGGSPCQGFSFAGKQLNFNDPRSKLFFEFVRLKNELKPTYFFLENVIMSKKSQDVISELLSVEPIFVNSSLVSAQKRKRLYWTNIPGFIMPEEKGILLADILQKEVPIKYLLSEKALNRGMSKKFSTPKINPDKAGALNTKNNSGQMSIDSGTSFITIERKALTLLTTYKYNAGLGDYLVKRRKQCVPLIDGNYRRLTPIECERLQALNDDYTNKLSDSARYHVLGNCWQVDTIVEFFKHLPKEL